MNKILSLLVAILISFNSFSQSTSFSKAYYFNMGIKAEMFSEINWGTGTPVDILIVISENKLKIYSKEIQEYRMTGKSIKTNKGSRFLAVDGSGLQCFVYIGNKDEIMYLVIEYSDYAWMYLITPSN